MKKVKKSHETIGIINAHQVVGVTFNSADTPDWINWIAEELIEHSSQRVFCYSLSEGLSEISYGSNKETKKIESNILPPPEYGIDRTTHYLNEFFKFKDNGIFIFQDLIEEIETSPGKYNRSFISYLKTICTVEDPHTEYQKRLIFLAHKIDLPEELIRLIPIIEYPLPNQRTREAAISEGLSRTQSVEIDRICVNTLAGITKGLSAREIENEIFNSYQISVLSGEQFSTQTIAEDLIRYKTKLLKRLGIETFNSLEAEFGGHEHLAEWISETIELSKLGLDDYGLPNPKGILLAGVSGCGKTLIAKAIASMSKLPLFKLNLAEMKGSYVGESENRLKNALALIKEIEGVLLIDEVEKSTSGVGTDSSGVSDGLMSILLQYMEEQSKQFVVLTANRVSQIPSELLRAGRLNERWFVDLPGIKSREAIFRIHLFGNKLRINTDYIPEIEKFLPNLIKMRDYSGAEIAEIVERGLKQAVLNQRPRQPKLEDFRKNLPVPLNLSSKEQHKEIEEYKKYARPTSSDEY